MSQPTILPIITSADNVLIVCHQRPDGDTLGSGLAFLHLIEALGKRADVVSDSEVPPHYGFMDAIERVNAQKLSKYDLCIVVDCADSMRMGKYADYAKSLLSINIDHHKTNDYFAKLNIVQPTASSTCEMVYNIFKAEDMFNIICDKAAKKIAASLMVGLSTDTGHFMHSSVNANVLQTACELVALGADIHSTANSLYRSRPKQKLALLGYALNNMRFYDNDSICVLSLQLSDFVAHNCSALSTEGFIDYPLSIKEVQVACTITQHDKQVYKVSFRSKGADVSALASTFGGGGHIRAAGCTINGVYEEGLDRVLKSIRDFI